MKGQN